MTNHEPWLTMGLDLGQAVNHTALAVVERRWHQATVNEFIASGGRAYQGEHRHTVVGADRLALGTPYPRVVDWVRTRASEYGKSLKAIVVDATGLGSAVMDLFQEARLDARVIGVQITGAAPNGVHGGSRPTPSGYQSLARLELLTSLQVAIQTERIQISMSRCREWEILIRELENLRFEGKSRGTQDDLAFALALAVWWGMR